MIITSPSDIFAIRLSGPRRLIGLRIRFSWPQLLVMKRSGSGTRHREHHGEPSKAIRAWSTQWLSHPTGSSWPRLLVIARSGPGTRLIIICCCVFLRNSRTYEMRTSYVFERRGVVMLRTQLFPSGC